MFFWGGKVICPDLFPDVKCFFPVENSRFGRPKTNFRRFQKWKAKKKKKKKKGPHLFSTSFYLFITFPSSIYNFPSSLIQFSFFSSQFLPLSHFSLPLFPFFPICKQKFPCQKSLGGTLPPAPRLLRHCLDIIKPDRGWRVSTIWLSVADWTSRHSVIA